MLTKYVLLYLVSGTRGGITRGRIIELLLKKPMNMNKISEALKLDYKTVQHHLNVLSENNIVTAINKGKYGALYHLTIEMESNIKLFKDIWN